MNKVSRVKNDNFTVISNVFLKDKNLSLKAKGFLSVIMGLPPDWEFSISGICAIIKEGKTAVYSVINELKDANYCTMTVCRDEKGQIAGNDYTFYEEPHADCPHTENPNMDNQPQLNTKGIKKQGIKNEDKIVNDWRTDFNAYMTLVNEAKAKLLADTSVRQKKEKYYPDIDYELSLEKMVDDFWGTEEGWKHKVKGSKKSASIDMVKTLNKGFDMASNRVYKRVQRSIGTYKQTAKPKIEIQRPKDGTNPDGTFNKNGFRYYHSVRDNFDYSIPLNAPAMPNFECEFDCVNQKWYNPNETTGTYGELW